MVSTPTCFLHKETASVLKEKGALIPGTEFVSCIGLKELLHGNPVHTRKCYYVNNDVIIITISLSCAHGVRRVMRTKNIPDD